MLDFRQVSCDVRSLNAVRVVERKLERFMNRNFREMSEEFYKTFEVNVLMDRN